jgi:hypothetical protein
MAFSMIDLALPAVGWARLSSFEGTRVACMLGAEPGSLKSSSEGYGTLVALWRLPMCSGGL